MIEIANLDPGLVRCVFIGKRSRMGTIRTKTADRSWAFIPYHTFGLWDGEHYAVKYNDEWRTVIDPAGHKDWKHLSDEEYQFYMTVHKFRKDWGQKKLELTLKQRNEWSVLRNEFRRTSYDKFGRVLDFDNLPPHRI